MSLQGRWKHSREDIILQTLGRYVDLPPCKIDELAGLLAATDSLTKGIASKIVSDNLGRLTAVPQTSEKYWVQRGWPTDEALLKSRERKLAGVRKTENIKSPFGREHWLEKINPATGQLYTIKEADNHRNSLRPIRKEYWLAKGHSEEESVQLAKAAKDKNNRNGGTRDSKYAQRTIGYYLVRGHSQIEATTMLAEAQATFSLEKLINKHGEEEGKRRWQERQDKWQNTLNLKSFEEQEDINRRKIYRSGMSNASSQLFEKIDRQGARWGKKTETNLGEMMVTVSGKKRFMIDFAYGGKLIEFYGDYWHANPNKYADDAVIFCGKGRLVKAHEKWEMDKKRQDFLKDLGLSLLIVWEHDFKTNPEKVIQECKIFLNS